jgi:hypothetical protein
MSSPISFQLFRGLLILTIVGLSLPVAAQTAAPVLAATAITKVPKTITKPGLYIVKADLVFAPASGDALTIAAPNVILDLGGHSLTNSAPSDSANTARGIFVSVAGNLTIRNGNIRGFNWGIFSNKDTTTGGEVLVEDVTMRAQTYTGVTARGNLVEVRHCTIIGTGGSANGTVQALSVGGDMVKVIDNTVLNMTRFFGGQDLTGMDIRGNLGMLVTGNTVMNDARVVGDTGIVTSYFGDAAAGIAKFVRNNQVSYFSVGFTLGGAKYEGNLTLGCTTPFSGGTAVGANN